MCEIQSSTNKLISQAKQRYSSNLGDKLLDPSTGHKTFWTAFKRIAKKSTQTSHHLLKITFTLQIFKKRPIYLTNVSNQCKIHDNGSSLPGITTKTNTLITHITISKKQIIDVRK